MSGLTNRRNLRSKFLITSSRFFVSQRVFSMTCHVWPGLASHNNRSNGFTRVLGGIVGIKRVEMWPL